jgi:Family of unknown function (DUF6399)
MEAVKNSTPISSRSHLTNKKKRATNVKSLEDFQALTREMGSNRRAAKLINIPRSTLQDREKKENSRRRSCPKVADFLSSAEGGDFLHRLVTAVSFGVIELAGGGLRVVQTILELSQLSEYVASSVGSLHHQVKAMEEAIIHFGDEEKSRLSQVMPEKEVMVASDETFPGSHVVLVGMELASNYILIEKIAPNRQFETWKAAWVDTLSGLAIKVIQSTSDEGSSILKCTKECLGAEHSPDLFHVLQDIGRATSASLRSHVSHCKAEHEKTLKRIESCTQAKDRDESCTRNKLGRPVDHIQRISEAEVDEDYAKTDLEEAQTRQRQVSEARKEISTSYHPIDLETGMARRPERLEQSLNQAFAAIEAVAESAELRESSIKGIEKARAMIDAMVSTLRYFWVCFNAQLKKYNFPAELETVFKEILMPAYYLKEAGRKAKTAVERQEIENQSQLLLTRLEGNNTWGERSELAQKQLRKQASQCAQLFQRSSSCVEGRNGQLSLKHHGLRGVSERKLSALTVIHNHFIKRADGTTAAERFYENKPRDLFEYLVANLDYMAEPAKRRRIV